jgi:ubiquinol-cytochrome c reductase subunit 6
MGSSITSFFSSFISSTHADTEENQTAKEEPTAKAEPAEEEQALAQEEQAPSEEEDEPEPEDVSPITVFCCHPCSYTVLSKEHPTIREECKHSSMCASLTRHFEHCQEKVHSGHGFKGEDCVEELCVFIDHCFVSLN